MADQVTAAAAYLLIINAAKKQRKTKRWWKRTLLRNGPRLSLLKKIDADDTTLFQNFTRMSHTDFENLLELVTPHIQRQDTNYHDSISPRMRLAITLRFLATGDSYKSLMYLFQVSYSTISLIVPEVCEAISSVLKDYIKVPKDALEWKDVARNFEIKWNFPHCIGAIDGKHVQIICPANTGTEYFNYKKTFSIVLMAIVDGNYCFQYVHIGCQGRMPKCGVYKNTSFHKALQENQFNIPMPESLPGSTRCLPYVFVADDAFPLRVDMLKPFRQTDLNSRERKIFNYRLSRARRIVENAFGILASRFRIYHTAINVQPENIEKIVMATCVLHNFLIEHTPSSYAPRDCFNQENTENGTIITSGYDTTDSNMENLRRRHQGNIMSDAKNVRIEFSNYFVNEGKVPWQDYFI
nr:unnamed protein product [Callosobruchus analis]